MPVYRRTVARRPGYDGSDRAGAHATYYLVVEAVTDAWEQVLRDLGDGVLPVNDLAVVRITFDYHHEVFVAPADFDVDVVRVGRSSVEFRVRLVQSGRLVTTAQIVLSKVNADRTASVPLSDRQRAALDTILLPAQSSAG
jgi:acyl-CoA thioesterase FadM